MKVKSKTQPMYVAMVECMGCPACHSENSLRYGAVTINTRNRGDHATFVTRVYGAVATRSVLPNSKTDSPPGGGITIGLECRVCEAPGMQLIIWRDEGQMVIQTRQPVPDEDIALHALRVGIGDWHS